MECPKCQLEIPDDSNFCNKCGYHLAEILDTVEPDLTIEGERKHVTILFSDLSGYTAMTEKLDPEEVKEIMNLIFGKITEIIQNYDGFIERFIGDAVMAIFGVPRAHEDDPIRAIRTAMEIRAAVEDISPKFEGKIGCPLTIHTGINTGLVVTGEVNIQKGTHGLTGDAINLASRLEGIANAGEIIVGPDTYSQAANYFEFEALEPTTVKGKQKPVSIYKVQSAKKESFKTHRLRGLQAALTGRDQEMNLLAEAAKRLKQGRGSIISINGNAGTGKSRLKKEFKDALDLKDIQWREGHAYSYTQNMPYYPLINLLTHAFQIDEGDAPDRIREKVESGVAYLLGEGNKYTPYIGSLFALTNHEVEDVSPEYWKEKLLESIQAILSALVDKGPTVICFEDLHWADPPFIELLKRLVVSTNRKALFIYTFRSHFTLFDSNLLDNLKDRYQEIHLEDLSTFEIRAMLKSLLDTESMPEKLYEFVQLKTEGNPFYLEEMINSLIESKILIHDNGNWKLTRKITKTDIPSTIQGLLTARVDRLEKHFKRILQESSVIGRTFLYKILEKITDVVTDVNQCLAGLENLDLIRTQSIVPELEYIFKHALTQEVVYNGLLKKERQEIHERIGVGIEKLFQTRLPDFYETLAYHFKQGHSHIKAIHYLMKSGEKCLKRYAVEESHQYYKEAFELLSKNLNITPDGDELLIDLIIDWALVFYYRGDANGLAPLLKSVENLAVSLGDQKRLGMLYAWIGYVMFWREQYQESYSYLNKALKIGKKIDSKYVVGYACAWLPYTCAELGLFEEGIAFGKMAQEVTRLVDLDKYVYIKSMSGIGYIHFFSGMKKEMLQIVAALENESRNIDPRFLGMLFTGYGLSHLLDGNYQMAIEQCLEAVQCSSDPIYSMAFRSMLGFSYLSGNNFQKAEVEAKKVVAFSSKSGVDWLGTMGRMILSVVSIANGQLSEGMSKLKEIQHASIKNESQWLYAQIEYVMGGVYLKIVQKSAPLSLIIIIKNIGFLLKNVPFAAKKAENHLKKSIESAENIGAKGILGQAWLDLGRLYRVSKKKKNARDCFIKAIDVFEICGIETFKKQAKEELDSLK